MRALVCETLGPVTSHRVQEIPDPVPGKRQVAIRVHACGVNFADTLIVQGKYQERPELPFVPGSEVAGEVIALGEGVKGIALGQRVMALTSVGGFAEIALASADTLIPLPDGIDFADAAAFTVAYGTSHVALETRAQLKAGETLIINGASGGVGLTALEIGKMMGATVIGLASTEKSARWLLNAARIMSSTWLTRNCVTRSRRWAGPTSATTWSAARPSTPCSAV